MDAVFMPLKSMAEDAVQKQASKYVITFKHFLFIPTY